MKITLVSCRLWRPRVEGRKLKVSPRSLQWAKDFLHPWNYPHLPWVLIVLHQSKEYDDKDEGYYKECDWLCTRHSGIDQGNSAWIFGANEVNSRLTSPKGCVPDRSIYLRNKSTSTAESLIPGTLFDSDIVQLKRAICECQSEDILIVPFQRSDITLVETATTWLIKLRFADFSDKFNIFWFTF